MNKNSAQRHLFLIVGKFARFILRPVKRDAGSDLKLAKKFPSGEVGGRRLM